MHGKVLLGAAFMHRKDLFGAFILCDKDPAKGTYLVLVLYDIDMEWTSPPAGSRMVTADLNIFLNKTMISASWVLTNVTIIRIIFGPLNYWLVFFCIGT